jgi:hypothetical protein
MRILVAWTVTAAVALVACGGDVVVDEPSGGTGGFGTGGFHTSSTGGFSSTVGTGGVFTDVGGGPSCAGPGSCSEALFNGGGIPCADGDLAHYETLQSCGGCSDTGNCQGVCGATLCQFLGVDQTCLMCLQTACSPELFACQND